MWDRIKNLDQECSNGNGGKRLGVTEVLEHTENFVTHWYGINKWVGRVLFNRNQKFQKEGRCGVS